MAVLEVVNRTRQRVRERRLYQQLFGAVSPTVSVTVRGATTLTIAASPLLVYVGQPITFTGKFARSDGTAIPYVQVRLFKETMQINTGSTDVSGNYSIAWTPAAVDIGTAIMHTEATDPAPS